MEVWTNEAWVGTLSEQNGLWRLSYSAQWLASPDHYPIAPSLPLQKEPIIDGSSVRPVQWYFDNLLPEEGQRILIAKAARVTVEDAFGLLACFGAESAGSLTLLSPGQGQAPGSLEPLTDEELSRRIREMPHVPLAEQAQKRMSLAGAQHKVAIVLKDGELWEPTGSMPSTHILKPDHPSEEYAHSVINEWFVMTLARRVGLNVPPVVRRYVPEPVYLIERFDRRFAQTHWERLHSIDACQLLQLDRAFKYSAGSIPKLNEIVQLCTMRLATTQALYRWVLFNVLIGNTDAHLKNLSFLMTGDDVELAPFYDLLSTAVYETATFDKQRWPSQVEMAWPIQGTSRMVDQTAARLIEAGQVMGLSQATATRQLAAMGKAIKEQAEQLLTEVEQGNGKLLEQRPELAATFAGEMRCLRAIVYVIIRDMCAQAL
ncbi:HipA domain-containing protein [Pseudomonas abieticivorans]|uniref:HipA domain-containing protein n=1 Tax=Pseudomonas abieticivorans TaxID=2931382 RepID=UPI0020BE424D|nr:HipA domain-containing protein [Pseudomonas sp. PIA16]